MIMDMRCSFFQISDFTQETSIESVNFVIIYVGYQQKSLLNLIFSSNQNGEIELKRTQGACSLEQFLLESVWSQYHLHKYFFFSSVAAT